MSMRAERKAEKSCKPPSISWPSCWCFSSPSSSLLALILHHLHLHHLVSLASCVSLLFEDDFLDNQLNQNTCQQKSQQLAFHLHRCLNQPKLQRPKEERKERNNEMKRMKKLQRAVKRFQTPSAKASKSSSASSFSFFVSCSSRALFRLLNRVFGIPGLLLHCSN